MTLLDRYVLRRFLGSLALSAIAMWLVTVVVDLIENIDTFIDHEASLRQIAHYYLFRTPYWVLLALPIGLQNCIFDEFLALVEARVAAAREAGTLDVGVETMTVETATVLDDTILIDYEIAQHDDSAWQNDTRMISRATGRQKHRAISVSGMP